MTKSPVVIHLVLKTRVNKQNKPSFSLKIPKVKKHCAKILKLQPPIICTY